MSESRWGVQEEFADDGGREYYIRDLGLVHNFGPLGSAIDASELADMLNERDRYRAALEKISNYRVDPSDEGHWPLVYLASCAEEALKDE